MTETHTQQGPKHPGVREYVLVAIWLAVATGIEIGLSYLTGLPDIAITALLIVFMVIKFALVVLWFMHLRFDSKLFMRMFVTGIVLTIALFVIVLATFGLFA